MGQKTNPIGNRLGIIRGWDSNWFGGRRFEQKLVEDDKIRKYLNVRLAKASISKIYIERTLKLLTVTINSARPGLIIGRAGSEVDKLREELKKLTGKDVQINISEVKRPEMDAVLVAQNIAKQIEGRIQYRRAIKNAVTSTMRTGAEGIKVSISGRIGGAEIARSEHFKEMPTLRLTPPMAVLVSRSGFAAVSSMADPSSFPRPLAVSRKTTAPALWAVVAPKVLPVVVRATEITTVNNL